MDLLVASVNAVMIAVVGLIVVRLGRGRFEAADRRFEAPDRKIDRPETRLDGRIDGLEGRFERLETRWDAGFETLQSSDAMRSDIAQVALAAGVRPRPRNG